MADLRTTYMGLSLRNPLIVGSSTHTTDPDRVKALEDAGAGAVVLKSIFEEQIRFESEEMRQALENDGTPEAYAYLDADLPMQLGPRQYLERLEAIKAVSSIPVIASINCVTPKRWTDFGRKVEAAGADGIELNIYDIPDHPEVSGRDIEQRHVAVVDALKSAVRIPVAVKIGPFYSSLLHFARTLAESKPAAMVLFNRFFQPDINIDTLHLESRVNFSRPEDVLLPVRWIAILREFVACDLCLTTGVHGADGAIKGLLAGANAFQICSALYQQKEGLIESILSGIAGWMDEKGFQRLDDFRGRVREKDPGRRGGFARAQYVRTLVGLE